MTFVRNAAKRMSLVPVYHDLRVRAVLVTVGLGAAIALLAAGCGGGGGARGAAATPVGPVKATCAYRPGWQALANRIGADVYCPGWLPDPLTSQIKGQWNNINQVSKDHSYLESFVWQDTDTPNLSGELHVNLRGYPDRTKIPTCLGGINFNKPMPCFASPHGHVTANGIDATLYTVNLDADTWHLLLLWHHAGGLYTISEHLAPPLDYKKVVAYLKHELGSRVLIAPSKAT
jgi:hypothetical protein